MTPKRFIPIPYIQWFNSFHNKTKAFSYMSKESFKYYYRWCEYVSKTMELNDYQTAKIERILQ